MLNPHPQDTTAAETIKKVFSMLIILGASVRDTPTAIINHMDLYGFVEVLTRLMPAILQDFTKPGYPFLSYT